MGKTDFHCGETKAIQRQVGLVHLVVIGLLLFAAPVLAQRDLPGRPTPDPYPKGDPMRVPPAGASPSRPASHSPSGMPPSSVIEITSSLVELGENVKLLREFDTELLEAAKESSAVRYEVIMTDASDIRKIAIRLLRGLSLPRPAREAAADNKAPMATAEKLDASITALDEAIQVFMKSAVLKEPRTIDADLLSKAGADLEAIVRQSLNVRQHAEALAINGRSTSAQPMLTMAHLKSKLKPKTFLQLSIECNAWSVDELLNEPAELKGRGSVTIHNVEAQTKRHKLARPFVVPIEDCVDAEADEDAIDKGLQYAAIVKDFTSFEVKGRVFAYQVTYQIGFTKNGQITKRFEQPVSFYYVDEAGDGSFDILKGPVGLGLLPDWAKELARKRSKFSAASPRPNYSKPYPVII